MKSQTVTFSFPTLPLLHYTPAIHWPLGSLPEHLWAFGPAVIQPGKLPHPPNQLLPWLAPSSA